MARHRTGLIAALDVGTSKTCCFIARVDGSGVPQIVGFGHHAAQGMRGGVIVDLEAAAASISDTIEAAERMAGETIKRVIVGVSAARTASHIVRSEIALNGRAIGGEEVTRALSAGRGMHPAADGDILHFLPLGYLVDGARGVRDPRGMYGERLGLDVHLVTAEAGPVRNLRACVERAHVEVEAMVVAGYAAGLAALTEDEKELGSTLIDMGGGTTGIAVFHEGELVFSDCIGLGGGLVTQDVAKLLATPINEAERLKARDASCMVTADDEQTYLMVPAIGETDLAEHVQVPRARLNRIVCDRVEETLEIVHSHLRDSGFGALGAGSIVLTGGASLLHGVERLAQQIFGKRVRIGRPLGIDGIPDQSSGPAFATCAGLLLYGLSDNPPLPAMPADHPGAGETGGMFGRIGRFGDWLRNNL